MPFDSLVGPELLDILFSPIHGMDHLIIGENFFSVVITNIIQTFGGSIRIVASEIVNVFYQVKKSNLFFKHFVFPLRDKSTRLLAELYYMYNV